MKSQKSSTSLNPCQVEIVGLLKNTLKTKHKERNHKEQHITQSLLYRWVGLLKNTLKTKHKERNHKRAAHHSIPAL
jgi:ABC-type antimicrobial peptide transport system ATPase subunit